MAARPRRGGPSLVAVLVVAVVLVFGLAVYVAAGLPVLDLLGDTMNTSTVEDAGYGGQMSFVLDVGILLAPTMLGIGIVLYVYAAVAGRGSYRGGGRL